MMGSIPSRLAANATACPKLPRVAVTTRAGEQFDLAINLNRQLSESEIEEEIDWLIVCAEPRGGAALAKNFGGFWASHKLWTEAFLPGETLDRALNRLLPGAVLRWESLGALLGRRLPFAFEIVRVG